MTVLGGSLEADALRALFSHHHLADHDVVVVVTEFQLPPADASDTRPALVLGGEAPPDGASHLRPDASLPELLAALQLTGVGYVVRQRPSEMLEPRQRTPLTPREEQVLEGLAAGCTARQIARDLGLSVKTVEAHKANLFRKIGAKNQTQAVALAQQRNVGPREA